MVRLSDASRLDRRRVGRLWTRAVARRRLAARRGQGAHRHHRAQRHRQVHAAPCDPPGEQLPDAGTVWLQPGVRVGTPRAGRAPVGRARRVRRRRRWARRSQRAGPHLPSRGDRGRAARHRRAARAARRSCSTSSKSATAGASSSASSSCSSHLELPADAVVDTLSGGWRRRVLLARALVAQPDAAAARRADQSPRHRGDRVARVVPRRVSRAPSCSSRTIARSCSGSPPASSSSIAARLTSWPGDYADLPAQEGGVAGERGPPAREVRQEARGGRGLAAPRHQGAPHARRGARAGAARDARRARGPARARSATVRLQVERARPVRTAGLRGRAP